MSVFICPDCKVDILIDKEHKDGSIDLICPKCEKYGVRIDSDVICLAKSCVHYSKKEVLNE